MTDPEDTNPTFFQRLADAIGIPCPRALTPAEQADLDRKIEEAERHADRLYGVEHGESG